MVTLRLHVISAQDLAPKDSNGASDPYVVIRVGAAKQQSKVVEKELNPTWNEVFDFKIRQSRLSPVINITIWDKDMLSRDYMGEVNIPLQNLFVSNCPAGTHESGFPMACDDARNLPVWYTVHSTKEAQVSGRLCIRAGLLDDGNAHSDAEWAQLWSNICYEADRNK